MEDRGWEVYPILLSLVHTLAYILLLWRVMLMSYNEFSVAETDRLTRIEGHTEIDRLAEVDIDSQRLTDSRRPTELPRLTGS